MRLQEGAHFDPARPDVLAREREAALAAEDNLEVGDFGLGKAASETGI